MTKDWEYKGELYNFIYTKISNKLVFDVGAHVGKLTKKFIEAGAKVVAIEPQTDLTANENFDGVLSIENVCISDKIGKDKFYRCSRTSLSTCDTFWKDCHNGEWDEVMISTYTLDYLIEKYGIPVYIKIDVESFEEYVLKGLTYNIDYISVEYTRSFRQKFINCLKEIERLGYSTLVPHRKRKRNNFKEGEFDNTTELLKYFDKLHKDSQGDLLIIK